MPYNQIRSWMSQRLFFPCTLTLSQTLTTLYLSNNRLGNQGIQHLANALVRTLVTVDLQGNQIGDLGAQYLAHALPQNKVLPRISAFSILRFTTDTDSTVSTEQSDRSPRCTTPRQCSQQKQGTLCPMTQKRSPMHFK
jgi:hypothetical protein